MEDKSQNSESDLTAETLDAQNKEVDEMLDAQNKEVDEMCGCPGKEKTRSNRVYKKFHEDWCFYYMHVADKVKKMVEERGWTSSSG